MHGFPDESAVQLPPPSVTLWLTVDGKGDKENGAGNSSGMDSPVSEMMESDLFIGACQIRHKPGCQHPRWSPRSDVRARLTTKPVLSTTAFRLTP